jgi:ABC-type glycerol-3-phosphate transport system permease component
MSTIRQASRLPSVSSKRRAHLRYKLPYVIFHALGLAILVSIVLIPVGYALLNSLRTPAEILEPPHLISKTLSFEGYRAMWLDYNFQRYFLNSFLLAFGSSLVALFVTIPGAYAVSRLPLPGRGLLFFVVAAPIMFPWILLMLPMYFLFTTLGLYDTFVGLLIALTAYVLPFNVWVLSSFFRGMPHDVEEAAMIDGCTRFGAFARVALPLAAPGLVVVVFFSFYQAWNNFILPFMLSTDESLRTVTAGVTAIMSPMEGLYGTYDVLLAAGLATMAVPVAVYLVMQRYILRGITYAEIGK